MKSSFQFFASQNLIDRDLPFLAALDIVKRRVK